jgi:glycyl-tRNA synthetase
MAEALGLAGLWLERRAELGFPLGEAVPQEPAVPGHPAAPPDTAAADFVMEIGTEELPPADADAAVSQLR